MYHYIINKYKYKIYPYTQVCKCVCVFTHTHTCTFKQYLYIYWAPNNIHCFPIQIHGICQTEEKYVLQGIAYGRTFTLIWMDTLKMLYDCEYLWGVNVMSELMLNKKHQHYAIVWKCSLRKIHICMKPHRMFLKFKINLECNFKKTI